MEEGDRTNGSFQSNHPKGQGGRGGGGGRGHSLETFPPHRESQVHKKRIPVRMDLSKGSVLLSS